MYPLWQRLRTGFVDILYPKTCAGCGLRGEWLCDRCERQLPRLDRGICFRCGSPVQALCSTCPHLDATIDMARSAYPYAGWVPDAVHRFKYGEEWSRAADLVERMTWVPPVMGDFDVVVPVPLHRARLRERGYNQAALLGEGLAASLRIPCRSLVVRSRATSAQAKLGRDERLDNVAGAFSLNPEFSPPPGMRILLVDDVRTTGATLNASARSLSQLSPQRICVATFALDMLQTQLAAWRSEYAP